MSDDLYTTWLQVPPGPRPPDHYALLGLPRFTGDRDEVERAAERRLARLDRFALHPDKGRRDQCQRMMNEVARARVVLVNPKRRAAYDGELAGVAAPSLAASPVPAAAIAAPYATFPAPAATFPAPVPAEEPPDELWQLAQAATVARPTRGRRVGLLQLVPAMVVAAALGTGGYYYVTRVLPDSAARTADTTPPAAVPRALPPEAVPTTVSSPSPTTEPATASLSPVAPPPVAPPPVTPPPAAPPPAAPPSPRTVLNITQPWVSEQVRLDRTDVVYRLNGTLSPPEEGARFTLSIGPGVHIEEGKIDLKRTGRLEIEGTPDNPAVLRNVKVYQDLGARVTAKYAVFDGCTFAKGGAWYSRHSSKWDFEACLLHECVFPELTGVDYGFKWNDCTFVSMDLPEIVPQRQKGKPFDVMDHLRREWNTVTRCRFVNCAVRPTIVWCSVQSNYAGCRFEPGMAYASDTVLSAAPWLAEVAGQGPQEAWAQNPPQRRPVYLVPADEPFEVFTFRDPLPVAELRDEAARRDAGLGAYDAERRALAKRAGDTGEPPDGRSLVFVCDASRFMAGQFDMLQDELSNAVIGLKPSHRFNVIFFQGERPSALSEELMPGTTRNKILALGFVHAAEAWGDRDSIPALRTAFAQRPGLVYLVSTEDEPKLEAVAEALAGLNPARKVKVNVIRFGDGGAPKDGSEAVLRRIAQEHGGVYRHVDTAAAP